jgi:hypothetical protein
MTGTEYTPSHCFHDIQSKFWFGEAATFVLDDIGIVSAGVTQGFKSH